MHDLGGQHRVVGMSTEKPSVGHGSIPALIGYRHVVAIASPCARLSTEVLKVIAWFGLFTVSMVRRLIDMIFKTWEPLASLPVSGALTASR